MILSLLVAQNAALAADDCTFSETDYYTLREELRTLHRAAGRSIQVAPVTPQCADALDTVLRNGPFLGVDEVFTAGDDPCVALLEPGGDRGWQLTMNGECRIEPRGPSNMVSVGPWLPYGFSARYNRDIGGGLSVLADFGWAPPRLWGNPFDFKAYGNNFADSSSMRWLVGLDMTERGLRGAYFGARGGVEAATPLHSVIPKYGAVSFVGGKKWIENGVAVQAGGGLLCEIPMGNGPQPSLLSPVAELRVGLTSRQ